MATETATLGGGCFWCLEAAFQRVRGVSAVLSGYAGGTTPEPSYHEVCTGRTGHAEVVRITFDPALVSYRQLLEVFFLIHDPTTLNRQGADVGTQYRSVIFYETAEQQREARELLAELAEEQVWEDPVVTDLLPLDAFYPAEAYHRDYYARNPGQAYCQVVIAPKLDRLRASARPLLSDPDA